MKSTENDMMRVVKSGLLYHYTDGKLFKSWKLRFAVLYDDDYLSIYKIPKGEVELLPLHRINMRKKCKRILTGYLCYKWKSMQLPDGVLDIKALFTVKMKISHIMQDFTFAALRASDCKGWEEAFRRAQQRAITGDVFEEAFLRRNKQDY